jgi:C1A family cysteine protease
MEFREDRRRKAFQDNLEKIRKHNEAYKNGTYSFKLSPNNLADLTNQQYLRHYVRLINSQIDEENDQDYVLGNEFDDNAYPATLDWREKGFVTKPSNQKSCGSCYAFSIAHSVEGQLFKKLGKIIALRSVGSVDRSRKIHSNTLFSSSPQQIVDCSADVGNHGCAGGSLRTSLKYLESSGGLMREVDYPYTATVSKRFDFDSSAAF